MTGEVLASLTLQAHINLMQVSTFQLVVCSSTPVCP